MFVKTNITFILGNEEYKITNTKPFQKTTDQFQCDQFVSKDIL